MLKEKLGDLSKDTLQEIIIGIEKFLSEDQRKKLVELVEVYRRKEQENGESSVPVRMSEEFVEEKLKEIKILMKQIDEGELYLDAEEYEDYSSGYWDRDWIVDYYDNQGIGEKILTAIRFAKDCTDDRRYGEAYFIYEWLWAMCVSADSELECDPVDLQELIEENIVDTDIEQLALLTLYADYQVQAAEKRAEDIYLYFNMYPFCNLHIEDMFRVGRENLDGVEKFWKDWITLLKTKKDAVAARLLKEAVLYCEGTEGLVAMADENCKMHPSLYLAAIKECEKKHDYAQIEAIGESALENIDVRLVIRSKTALRAALASSALMHTENMMRFCWEGFRSDTNDRNFLRLFGTAPMAEKYGLRGKEVLSGCEKGQEREYIRNEEMLGNIVGEYERLKLSFYMGDFEKVREASKNPAISLGWSSRFIKYGIRLFLLYLYENPWPTKAATGIASTFAFYENAETADKLNFENEITEEAREHKASEFWCYFKRWKQYFPMEQEERQNYLAWAEKIVYSRADAIVKGQHRGHYAEVAELLAMVAEIKEQMGMSGEKERIFAAYKSKFPRHSSFQAEMKRYFGYL